MACGERMSTVRKAAVVYTLLFSGKIENKANNSMKTSRIPKIDKFQPRFTIQKLLVWFLKAATYDIIVWNLKGWIKSERYNRFCESRKNLWWKENCDEEKRGRWINACVQDSLHGCTVGVGGLLQSSERLILKILFVYLYSF